MTAHGKSMEVLANVNSPQNEDGFMITFQQRSWLDSIKRLSPSYRRKQDAELLAAIRTLTENPWMPCNVDGVVIPNGYGR